MKSYPGSNALPWDRTATVRPTFHGGSFGGLPEFPYDGYGGCMDSTQVVKAVPKRHDCPECRAKGTVLFGVCDVCFAEFGEGRGRVLDANVSWDLDLDEPLLEIRG